MSDLLQVQFWNRDLSPVLASIVNGDYKFTKIQEIFNDLIEKIKAQYQQQQVSFNICRLDCLDKVDGGNCINFSSAVDKGIPKVAIYLPSLQMTLQKLQSWAKYDFVKSQDLFESYVVIAVIHELYHLASGLVGTRQMPLQELIDIEIQVWAYTCEHIMELFSKVYLQELSPLDSPYYDAWTGCQRNIDSQQWKDHIASIYKKLKRV